MLRAHFYSYSTLGHILGMYIVFIYVVNKHTQEILCEACYSIDSITMVQAISAQSDFKILFLMF